MTEPEIRALRARVYGECSDNNWEHCRERWMTVGNVKWLQDEVEKINNKKK